MKVRGLQSVDPSDLDELQRQVGSLNHLPYLDQLDVSNAIRELESRITPYEVLQNLIDANHVSRSEYRKRIRQTIHSE